MSAESKNKKPFVYLVGAGPGRADLITVRGANAIAAADCIIADKLANPALLKFARPDAEIVPVPKRIGPGSFTQDAVNRILLEKAAPGRIVVRLKGGDPCIFGRAGEELAVLKEHGIEFEIVPGITAAVAAGAYAGIILTDRDYASQIAFITGHEAEEKEQSAINWKALADFAGTLVFYMGMSNLAEIADRLIQNGLTPDTPAAVIQSATFPGQRIAMAPLSDIDNRCKAEKIGPPAIVVIGRAADADNALNWFMRKPLFGKTILVTRDVPGNAAFAAKIIRRGGSPVEFATIKIRPLTDSAEFIKTLAQFSKYHWIIFTSVNGVTTFFDALYALGKDARAFASAKVAAIGSRTAAHLADFGIKADFVPTVFTGRQLAAQLIARENLQDKRILLLRSRLASSDLPDVLREAAAEVADVPIYTADPANADPAPLFEQITTGRINWLTFASPSSARIFFEQISPETVNASKALVASVGPVTTDCLEGLGVRVDLTAAEHTIDGLLDAIEGAC
ncbi:MAG: uroporphyrinogen-III C-methyltransferase [Phycisphaerales bacterium]|nr:MAG: uroporphyrinogen-III C-methyltransferase [Phycisphaerales bacterium]